MKTNPPNRSAVPLQVVPQTNLRLCPVAKKCGGCQLQNMAYPRQLAFKQGMVQRLLGAYGKVEPILGMENPFHYRNKVQAAFAFDRRRSKILSGVYQSSTHRVVYVDRCLIEDKQADEIIVTIRGLLKSFKLTPYDENRETGFLRHVLVKRGFQSGQIMVVLVTATPVFPAKNRFVEALLQAHPQITTVLMNTNRHHTNLVLGDTEKVLYGPGYIEDTLCGCVFRISARSFYQVNPVQTQVLYQKAMDLAELTGKETVIDAYCGIGTIGLIASRRAGRVIGVEVNPDAVRDAISNARRNGVKNSYFIREDAGEFLTRMAQEGRHADVVFMDPPRAGSTPRFLSSLAALAPDRIVYISCNPETLARDLRLLDGHGYRVRHIQPVDMFPHTSHVEVVCLLTKAHSAAKKSGEGNGFQ